MLKVRNWEKYTHLFHTTLTCALDLVEATKNERVRELARTISHYLCKGLYGVASVRVMSAVDRCKKLEDSNLTLLLYSNYYDLLELLEFTED